MADVEQDSSADTGRFQAFVQRTDAEPPPAWQMDAPASRIGLMAGIVVAVAIALALIAWAIVG